MIKIYFPVWSTAVHLIPDLNSHRFRILFKGNYRLQVKRVNHSKLEFYVKQKQRAVEEIELVKTSLLNCFNNYK